MNLDAKGNEEVSQAYGEMTDACDRLTAFSQIVSELGESQMVNEPNQVKELLKIYADSASRALVAAYRVYEVMEHRIDTAEKR